MICNPLDIGWIEALWVDVLNYTPSGEIAQTLPDDAQAAKEYEITLLAPRCIVFFEHFTENP